MMKSEKLMENYEAEVELKKVKEPRKFKYLLYHIIDGFLGHEWRDDININGVTYKRCLSCGIYR